MASGATVAASATARGRRTAFRERFPLLPRRVVAKATRDGRRKRRIGKLQRPRSR
jgi:hypothetical protein